MIDPHSDSSLPSGLVISIIVIICALAALLIFALFTVSVHENEVYILVMDEIHLSGVTNPVTAILLNFRAYDTLLEFAVLFSVSIACLPYLEDSDIKTINLKVKSTPLFVLVKTLVPLAILLSGYLLWVGSFKPGGAFQAGAILAGAGLLLSLSNIGLTKMSGLIWRAVFSFGLIVFVLVIGFSLIKTKTFLLFPSDLSGSLILLIEFAATFSIAATLYLCYLSVRGKKTLESNL